MQKVFLFGFVNVDGNKLSVANAPGRLLTFVKLNINTAGHRRIPVAHHRFLSRMDHLGCNGAKYQHVRSTHVTHRP